MNYKVLTVLLLAAALTLGGCSQTPEFGEEVQSGVVDTLGKAVTLDGNLTITEAGTYILSGAVSEGQLTIDIPKDESIELILNGVDLRCSVSAPLYIKTAEKVTITLADGSVNKLANTGSFKAIDDNSIDAVLFSKEDLDIRGDGTLYIGSATGNGITSKDDLRIKSGSYTIDVGGHALEAKDELKISGGTYTLKGGKDALHAENKDDTSRGNIELEGADFTLEAGGDGIDASGYLICEDCDVSMIALGKGMVAAGDLMVVSGNYTIDSTDDALHSNADLTITDGALTMKSKDDGVHADAHAVIDGGSIAIEGTEGIEGTTVTINGGTISILASDDGMNSAGGNDQSGTDRFGSRDRFMADKNCDITINGGHITIDANGDGIDSNGSLNVTGGELYLSGPTNNNNGTLDYGGEASITGGAVIAAGPVGMAQNFGAGSSQCSALVTFANNTSGEIVVKDAGGAVLASFTPNKKYSMAVISLPEFKVGESYTIEAGGNVQTITFDTQIIGGSGGFGGGRGGMPPQGGKPDGRMPK